MTSARAGAMLAAGLAALLALALGSEAGAQNRSLEYPVKATYLYKFAPFVDWPPTAFASPTSPVNLCVAGDDPFGAMLEQAVAGQQISGRPVAVRRLQTVGPRSGCHILYVAGSRGQSAAEALKSVDGTSVLTVTDAARTPNTRGVIHFVVQNDRVRFHIDEQAAARNRLSISSKLLSLALSVRHRG